MKGLSRVRGQHDLPLDSSIGSFGHITILQIRNLVSVLLTRNYRDLKLVERSVRILVLLSNPARHLRVIRAISAPELRSVLVRQPQASIKYLIPKYLALGLTTGQRADAFCHHYKYICKQFSQNLLHQVLHGELLLWSYIEGENAHQISMGFSDGPDNEGELSVYYEFNSSRLYIISFTFVAGSTFQIENDTIVFVTRIQGTRESYASIRGATKSLNDISPPFALMAALQGFACALGVKNLVGISTAKQIASESYDVASTHGYENFFLAIGATPIAGPDNAHKGPTSNLPYFQAALPLAEKPITDVKRGHRSRVNAKRRIRKHISDLACEAAEIALLR